MMYKMFLQKDSFKFCEQWRLRLCAFIEMLLLMQKILHKLLLMTGPEGDESGVYFRTAESNCSLLRTRAGNMRVRVSKMSENIIVIE